MSETKSFKVCECIDDIYKKAVSLFYETSENTTKSCGHPGISGPSSMDVSWDSTRATLESAIHTLQICLKNYKK